MLLLHPGILGHMVTCGNRDYALQKSAPGPHLLQLHQFL
jgi:hypothetical protein